MFFIGPMTKNTVDALRKMSAETDGVTIGILPTRRQVEHDGGYSNSWTTGGLRKYLQDTLQDGSKQEEVLFVLRISDALQFLQRYVLCRCR